MFFLLNLTSFSLYKHAEIKAPKFTNKMVKANSVLLLTVAAKRINPNILPALKNDSCAAMICEKVILSSWTERTSKNNAVAGLQINTENHAVTSDNANSIKTSYFIKVIEKSSIITAEDIKTSFILLFGLEIFPIT